MSDMKTCSKCGVEKPLDAFSRDSRAKDKLQSQCKMCQTEYRETHKPQRKAYCESRKQETKIYNLEYRKKHVEELRMYDRDYYNLHRDKKRQYNLVYRRGHIAEISSRQKTQRHKNLDKGRVHVQNRRARKLAAEGTHTAQETQELYEMQKGICAYCGCDLSKTQRHLDHVIPLKRGGSNWIGNLKWACRRCNTSKGDKLLSEWKPNHESI